MLNISGAVCGALLILGATVPVVAAQRPLAPTGRIPVSVAVTDSANFGQAIVILRRPDADPPNAILMSRAAATPEHLAAAAATLSAIMRRDGDRPSAPGLFRVSTSAEAPSAAIEPARAALARLGAVSTAPLDLTGVGPARMTRIYLPDHAARDGLMRDGRMQRRVQGPAGGGR
ncbi:MAG: hypothetical protein ACRENQ_03335 [Gemmatimonadaceae bacterium]